MIGQKAASVNQWLVYWQDYSAWRLAASWLAPDAERWEGALRELNELDGERMMET